jgi:hypothetical protein
MLPKVMSAGVLLACSTVAWAELEWFSNEADFVAANTAAANVLFAVEDFEESNLYMGSELNLYNPLETGIPNVYNGLGFPDGLSAPDLRIQTQPLQMPRPLRNMRHPDLGSVVGASWIDGTPLRTTEIIFSGLGKYGIGLDVYDFLGGQSVQVTAYGADGGAMGSVEVPSASFVGVLSESPVNTLIVDAIDYAVGAEAVDNIQMWTPEPASFVLLVFALLAVGSRRNGSVCHTANWFSGAGKS